MNDIDFEFLGEKFSDELMCSVADGVVHPVTFN